MTGDMSGYWRQTTKHFFLSFVKSFMNTDNKIGVDSERRNLAREKKLSWTARRKLKRLQKVETTLPARKIGHEEGLVKACAAEPRISTEPVKQALSGRQMVRSGLGRMEARSGNTANEDQ